MLDGELIVTSQSERSQLKNREKATEKLFRLIAGALTEKLRAGPLIPPEGQNRKDLRVNENAV